MKKMLVIICCGLFFTAQGSVYINESEMDNNRSGYCHLMFFLKVMIFGPWVCYAHQRTVFRW